ncbi:hypothetical protein FHR32_002420 [Streptosporangium album]|uniref:Uncharacterized protein n=1 Tax=Streptosporangium album TaxID=47479 RepID=A0A7W7W9J6_9ACTN|nr:hypothetical protein [Streptosporangium album]
MLMICSDGVVADPVNYPLSECLAWHDEMDRRGVLREVEGLRRVWRSSRREHGPELTARTRSRPGRSIPHRQGRLAGQGG